MRVVCNHGYFKFYPRRASDISRFVNYFQTTLEQKEDFYTFPFLKDLKNFSLMGLPYKNLPAVKTFEGTPQDVLKENGFVYHLATKLLVPKTAVTILLSLPPTGFYYLSPTALIQPGTRNPSGNQILSYDAEYDQETFELRVLGFNYE